MPFQFCFSPQLCAIFLAPSRINYWVGSHGLNPFILHLAGIWVYELALIPFQSCIKPGDRVEKANKECNGLSNLYWHSLRILAQPIT